MITLSVEAETADDARTTVARMCDQLLANPVIETYVVVVEPATSLQEAH